MKKTNLQMRTGLNYARFTEYFEWLIARGFLQRKEEDEAELYSLSPQGSMPITG